MKLKNKASLILGLLCVFGFTQEYKYQTVVVDALLTNNANAIIRDYHIHIDVESYSKLRIKSKKAITVLNEDGLRHIDSYVSYDPYTKVKHISAIVYNSFGEEIKKFKKKEFKDYSASGGSLYTDNRVLGLDYTPVQYPFTFVFEYETENMNTAFYPLWYPMDSYNLSVEHSTFNVNNPNDIPLNVKTYNLNIEGVSNGSNGNSIRYEAKGLKAIKWESLSPSFNKIAPSIRVAPEQFRLISIDGYAKNWSDFGKWSYQDLLHGRADLPTSTIAEVTKLVSNLGDPIKKAKKIYEYVQNKTRYISVQLGVGGWQPISASKVDEVSYGDCKGLTNYTMALLHSQNIPAFYTVVYGDKDIRNIDKDIVGMQGNHVILNIPNGKEDIWLECTSQKVPFGHIANFTDDRDVFVVKPTGGEIKHTKIYTSKDNYLNAKATITLEADGGFKGTYSAKSGGTRYDYRLDRVIDEEEKNRKIFYKNYWDYINELQVDKIQLKNDKDEIVIEENIEVSTPSYLVEAGDKMLFAPNVFKRSTQIPSKYSKRKLSFSIERGYSDEDEFTIQLPSNLSCKSLPEPKKITTKFGVYKVVLEKRSESQIVYRRSLEIFKGKYSKEDYKAYRSFRRKIAKSDKSSIVLNKNN
ncbi:MAG: DUF3857 domain-containing protein [Flavobacteriaceae bacterium]|nr:DUF3857 domain-containing protein [Flavobacteriaceae bacterium]